MDNVESAVAEIKCCNEELGKLLKTQRLRNRLKFLFMGFLIGRTVELRISEINKRRQFVENWLFQRFTDIEVIDSELKEIHDNAALLNQVDLSNIIQKILMIGKDLSIIRDSGISDYEEKYRTLLCNVSEKIILQEKERICKEISKVVIEDKYLEFSEKKQFLENLRMHANNLSAFENLSIVHDNILATARKDLRANREFVTAYNDKLVERRKKEYAYLFVNKKFSLDEEQKKAIITDDKYNLVVAAAGSGKTEVLATRIAYLIKQKSEGIKPNRILAIAFQDKAREEIEKRLEENFGITGVNVKTFHTLGKGIVEKYKNRKFFHNEILDDNHKFSEIRKIYKQKLQEKVFYQKFLEYMRFFNSSQAETLDKEAILNQREAAKYVSINNTLVNSRAEKEIMDFFLTSKINGKRIKIEYEPDFCEYQPDFRLTDFDLYIEHWGINKEDKVPDNFKVTSEQYKLKMNHERELFKKEKKLFVETFSWEHSEMKREEFLNLVKERILAKLKERNNQEFELLPMTYAEIVDVAWAPYKDPTPKDIMNFIKNAKVYGLTPERISEKLKNGRWTPKQETFSSISLEVYEKYEQLISNPEKIDFEDMINKSIDALLQNSSLYYDVYDHILIDEYQDISAQRNRLIELILARNPKCKLFCVGDDWQSIMGFAGSNVNFFLNFANYFPNPEISKIQTNYRSQSVIVDAGAVLIANNRNNQVQKITHSNKGIGKKILVVSSDHKDKKYEAKYFENIAQDCVNKIYKFIEDGVSPNDILVLSRFVSNAMVVQLFKQKAANKGISFPEKKERLKKNQIRFMSAHSSKGQQAKVVFVLNAIRDRYGFPCEIEDISIFEPARENYPKQDQRQEERRLFYVAMTRAKEELVIYTWDIFVSQFIKEIDPFIVWEPLHYWVENI